LENARECTTIKQKMIADRVKKGEDCKKKGANQKKHKGQEKTS
jgi:hypothetical protein